MARISRTAYAALFGPTTGDRFRLGDTALIARVERDLTSHGEELSTGAGKLMRDGEGFQPEGSYAAGALDMVVQNATILDPLLGVVKADIGIRDTRIVGIGKAGNPDLMAGVSPGMVTGPNTTVMHAEPYVVTPGGIEAHAHFLSPEQIRHALAGGVTTMIGMSPGPGFDVTCSGPNTLGALIRACDAFPLNFGFLGRGCMDAAASVETVAAGALGVKVHEDFGAAPATIDGALTAADAHDWSVHLHTDTINEYGFCEDTLAAIGDRTIHMYHTEGAGGGHAPDLIVVNGRANVLPSSTNPTNPFTPAALEEGLPMTMLCHALSFDVPEDVAFAEARLRPQTMAAEDCLHDLGAISMFATDSQGMGRLAENMAKCFQLASVMKDIYGPLADEPFDNADNARILRYLAKLTVNPAIAAGIDDHVGMIAPGRMADLVLWPRASFGAKPAYVIKGGTVVWGLMGDANGSHMTCEPVLHRPLWGMYGTAVRHLGATFVSRLAIEAGTAARLGVDKPFVAIKPVRRLRKHDMVRNSALPAIVVDAQTFDVTADGRRLWHPPVTQVPLNRRYMLR